WASEVSDRRSAAAVSIICDLQTAGTDCSALGQVMADTPRVKLLTVGGVRKMRVVACNVPVEPKSTSASPPPKTLRWPGSCSAESISPRKVGALPNEPDQ